jgi:hypothetical protein
MVELEALEEAGDRRAPDSVARLLAALEAVEGGGLFGPGVQPADGFRRLAATAASILAGDPALTDQQRWRLAYYNGLLNSLFAVSDAWPPAPVTLDSPHWPGLEAVLAGAPDEVLPRALGLIATSPVLTHEGAHRREALLEHAATLDGARLLRSIAAITLASAAWMFCSYASGPAKHGLKPMLNRASRRLTRELGLADRPLPAQRLRPERPTMVVAAEVIQPGHVQFRYFGQYLRQLRRRFRLVLVAPVREIAPAVTALFDETHAFDPFAADSLARVTGLITAAAPDIVFWPSVGMARWGPVVANLRLAPIQMTALGHSASTFIPTMDYYLTEEGYVSDPALFSETLLLLPDESLRFERPPADHTLAPEIRETAEPVRVAVPSNVLKLNPGFLELLARIREAAGRPVQLHLFPNAGLLPVTAIRRAAGGVLQDAVIYPRMNGHAYQEALNACDLVLSPFPFGGLHSVVDALRLGLPVVCMVGAEPHARTDAMILRRLGLPGWLVASDEAAYVAAALRLIDDDALRLSVSRSVLASDAGGEMFGDAETPIRCEVADAVWAAFQAHEAIQASGRKVWRLAELAALAPLQPGG